MARRPVTPPVLGPLEEQVMEALWREGEASVREVLIDLNETGPALRAYTTVMTVMHRLDRKRLLSRRRQGRNDVFRPRISRRAYIERRVEADVDALVERYGDVAYFAFARVLEGPRALGGRATAPPARRG